MLWLCDSAERVRAQLAGARLTRAQAGALRDDVSTDEIIPLPAMVHFDATLGRHPYTGFTVNGERPIGVDAIHQGNFDVVVGGRRYGKGSSREHSVVAERAAGVRLVIAESFERIYRQNADNLGLWTSTDFTLIERIQRGDAIDVEELLAGRDALASDILRAGGLLARAKRDAAGSACQDLESQPVQSTVDRHEADVGQAGEPTLVALPPCVPAPATLFDKIIDRHTMGPRLLVGQGGFVRADWRFIHEYYTGMAAWLLDEALGDGLTLHDSASIVCFEDHLSYVHQSPAHLTQGLVGQVTGLSRAHRAFVARHGLRDHGYMQALEAGDPANEGSQGISHAMMAERYALPGQLVVGTDSHTPHSGALGCVAYGVGTTDMANAFLSGRCRLTRPEVLRVEFNGTLPAGLTAKDLALHLLAQPWLRAGEGVGRVFEFAGPVVRRLSIDERATLTNMVAEMGGFTGLVEPDAETVRFLAERRGIVFALEDWMVSDAGAPYAAVYRIDCSALSPMVARPGDPGRGLPLSQLDAVQAIHIAYGGSCTAGKREDFDHYHAVLAWGLDHGLRVAPGVQLYLQFGTQDVREHCERQGYLATFEAVGATLLQPACGACANCGPGSSTTSDQVTVSAINRNFPGRSGPGSVWLASPPTVAASALAGRLVSFAQLQASQGA